MKYIELSKQGKHKGKYVAIVDDDDYERINNYRWQVHKTKHGIYAIRHIRIKGINVNYFMHNEISGAIKPMQTDHINHNGLDNRKENLRICTQSENNCNKKGVFGKVKYHGVSEYERVGRIAYIAFIKVNKKTKNLGTFDNAIDAAKEYDKNAKLLFGEFSKLNFKD